MIRRNAPRPALAAAAAIVCAALASGCAVTKTPYSRDGFYVGASVMGFSSDFGDDVEGNDLDDSDGVAGLGLRAGYRFLDLVAAEFVTEYAQDFEFDNDVDVSIGTYSANAKLYLSTRRVQPYVLAGVGIADGKVDGTGIDESDVMFRIGGGLEGYINRYVPLFFELGYVMPTGDLDELSYLTGQVGVAIRF